MGRLVGVALTGVVLSAAALNCFSVASGEEQSLLARCFSPAALAGTTNEIKPSRNRAKLDVTLLKEAAIPARPPVSQAMRGPITSVTLPQGTKLIALTFDLCETDGSTAGYDGRIVDLLRAEGVKATFFAGGKWMETHPERAAQLIADPAFEIGSHGFRHRDMARLGGEALIEEIRLADAAYTRAHAGLLARQCAAPNTGAALPPPHISLFRFPYGRCNAASLAAVADQGEFAIQWDIVTGDPDPHRSAKAIAKTILDKAHPGAIVIGHANGRGKNTAEALALAIPKLKEEGYSFVTVSELLAAGTPVIATSCSPARSTAKSRLSRESHAKRQSFFGLPGLSGAAH
ncbi:MAG TPA: polysaccharide deacetylase family protein [Methyloceanibacter sp.]|nr:polysaccharide deacetylase family protein [Methyloceanibacter sp.]